MIPVMETIARIGNGAFLADLQRELRDVVASVHATDKAGKVSITLDIKPLEKTGTVSVSYKVEGKVPRPDNATLFFPDAEGELHRQHPKQRDIFSVGDSAGKAQGE